MNLCTLDAAQRGWTRLEVLVSVITLALLIAVIRPVWGSGHATKRMICSDNLRRLSGAWLLYADENQGKFAGNYHGGFVPKEGGRERPWATGWLNWQDNPDNTNTTYLTHPRYAVLSPYVGAGLSVFKCPADEYLSRRQQELGWTHRVRSYSLSCALGEGNVFVGPYNPRMLQVTRASEFTKLSPQQSFAFLEEHPDSINDPLFFVPNSAVNMPDVPGSLHDGAAWFSFADGHLELRRWESRELLLPVRTSVNANNLTVRNRTDLEWLLNHTPQR